MEILDENIQSRQLTSEQWWAANRLKYNKGLVISGITAFMCYVLIGSMLFSDDIDFEITIFTTVFQGLGYLIMIGIANLLYNLGHFVEVLFKKTNNDEFRKQLFNLGYWFSVGLPFLIPLSLILMYFIEH
jgi:uncharacterized membrane protein